VRPAYHEMMGLLGVGDLHPGGRRATAFLLDELGKARPRTVLEVGAGAGRTTERMLRLGWRVTPIEPSTVLAHALHARLQIPTHTGPFETFDDALGPFDAAIGEGVFYRLDPETTASKLRRLIRPGGLLAFMDMTWTETAKADVAAFVYDQTLEVFGIPMAPRDVTTARRWAAALRAAGFAELAARTIDPSEFDDDPRERRARVALGLLRHPAMIPLFLQYRSYRRIRWAPPGWLESRMAVWTRG